MFLAVSVLLRKVLKLMDARLELPLNTGTTGVRSGCYRRRIERQFVERRDSTPRRCYLELCLIKA
ncbi:hypothetical protein C4K37_2786 [Pseudomonas chlororaphis subsp. piscium]|nr:hypothetical protein C4K37_2786 [Pseudomonas chlororaphis subsp. piscium]AZC43720.1 hypothetical protein C4K36_2795 [Pseudomonas chlororaphis subsp. piscium]AZC89048.1 hypothetical protein C4K29_2747 [Pseudomonas chlororaphis subsp. piscium]AZC95434.1 hypothetical protein C4K28_2706 [Pseudomonas chlororaphis subsp. piscium]